MLDLQLLPAPPGSGDITACECEGVLRSNDAATAAIIAQNMLGSGEPILQSESNESVRPALGKQDTQLAFTAKPRLPATIALAYRERGILGCLEQVSDSCSGVGGASGAVGMTAAALLAAARGVRAVTDTIAPNTKFAGLERTISSRTQSSSTGGIGSSNIICISWHGVSRRLAVGYTDDSVRIMSHRPLQPLLKHRTQRAITQVHWLPYSMSVVCVACDAGVLLWSVDPSSVVTRPSGACITLLPSPYTSYGSLRTVMATHPQGLCVSASSGRGVSVWDVSLVTSVRVQESGTVTHLLYSPDATQLLVVVSDPPTLRVFNTVDWSFLEWVCSSAVSCCTWSGCSRYVVFCTSDPCALYSVSPDTASNTATLLADLALVQVQDAEGDMVNIGGPVLGLSWGGERLVVLFQSCPYIALFHTLTLYTLKLAPGGIIKGPDDCVAVTASFHPSQSSLLTVVWSNNSLQHIPLLYTSRQTTNNLNLSLNATLTAYNTGLNSTALNNTPGLNNSAGINSLLSNAGGLNHHTGGINNSVLNNIGGDLQNSSYNNTGDGLHSTSYNDHRANVTEPNGANNLNNTGFNSSLLNTSNAHNNNNPGVRSGLCGSNGTPLGSSSLQPGRLFSPLPSLA